MRITTLQKYAAIGVVSVAGVLANVQTALALDFALPEPTNKSVVGETGDRAATNTINTIGQQALTIILTLAGALAVFYLIYSGILYITAGGNADRTKQARAGIINAVIGIVVILAAFFIVRFASSIGSTVEQSDDNVTSYNFIVAPEVA